MVEKREEIVERETSGGSPRKRENEETEGGEEERERDRETKGKQ